MLTRSIKFHLFKTNHFTYFKMHTKKNFEVIYRVPSNLYKDIEHGSLSVVCVKFTRSRLIPASVKIRRSFQCDRYGLRMFSVFKKFLTIWPSFFCCKAAIKCIFLPQNCYSIHFPAAKLQLNAYFCLKLQLFASQSGYPAVWLTATA